MRLKRDPSQPAHPHNPLDPTPATGPAPHPENPPAPPVAQTSDAAIAALKDLGPVQADPKRDWLMIVYLDGDNSLDEQGAFNLRQMEHGFPDSGVDVIVLYDRPITNARSKRANPPTRVYRVRHSKRPDPDSIESEVVKDLGPIDMADPKILSAFIEGAVKTFPARQHALFTWDHGGGWAGLTEDDNAPAKPNHYDIMDMEGFRTGVVDGMKAAGLKKWDVIAFDMCLMCQLEVAAQIHDLTDVMIASEAEEPGKGMPYSSVLEALGEGNAWRPAHRGHHRHRIRQVS